MLQHCERAGKQQDLGIKTIRPLKPCATYYTAHRITRIFMDEKPGYK